MDLYRSRRAGLACLLLCAPGLAEATSPPGLAGRVVDRVGDPISIAEVTLTCAGREPRTLATDENGRFSTALPIGAECAVRASLPGADASVEVRSPIPAAGHLGLELRLDIAGVRELIEVAASRSDTTLEAREIRESFARDAGEAVSRLEGVARLRKGGLGSDVVLRGLKGEDLNLLVDGHRLYGACPNRMDPPSFHVDFAEIERIEVSKGPFDARHGGLSGTVNLVTRQPDPGLHATLQATAGSWGTWAPSLSVTWANSHLSLKGGTARRGGDPFVSGGGLRSTELLPLSAPAGYRASERDARAFDAATTWAGIAWHPAAGQRLEIAATRQESDNLLYPYLQMDAERDDATRARLTWLLQRVGDSALESLEVSASWSEVDHTMTDRRRVSSATSPAGYSMATDALARVATARVEASVSGGWTVGLEAWQRGWDARTRLQAKAYRPQASLPDAESRSETLFASWRHPLGSSWTLDAGARLDQVTSDADPQLASTSLFLAYHGTTSLSATDLLPSAHLTLRWAPSDSWLLSLGAGRAARAPDSQERTFGLSRMGTDWVGNPALEPSHNTEIDLGWSFKRRGFAAQVDLFSSWISNAISVVEIPRRQTVPGVMNSRARSWVNHDQRLQGGEVTLRWAIAERWLLSSGLSAVFGRQELAPTLGIRDRDLPEMPAPRARLALRYEGRRAFGEVEGVGAARQSRVDADLYETPTPGWTTVALRGGGQLGPVELLVGLENLFDRDYSEGLSYQRDPFRSGVRVPEPGRAVTVSLRVSH